MMKFEYKEFFPFKEERIEQTKSINFTLDSFLNKNKRFVVLENPVGSGKSGIAITLARYLSDKYVVNDVYQKGSYIITTQKILQTQYANEFKDVCNIWSKANYRCVQNVKTEMNCELGQWVNSFSRTDKGKAIYNTGCPYKLDKKNFINGDIGLTNTQFLLNNLMYTDEIKRRNLLVVDEAHTLENAVIEFVAMNFDGPIIEMELEINWMHCTINTKSEDFIKWISTSYLPALKFKMTDIENELVKFTDSTKFTNMHQQLLKKYDEYDRLICQINRCLNNFDSKNWVMSVDVDKQKVSLKPIFASIYSENVIFRAAEKILLMSGTILDKEIFCKNLGIKVEDCEFLSLESSFPKENRPIIVFPVGSMNYRDIKNTLPNLAIAIKELLKQHKGEKGIIHCVEENSKILTDNGNINIKNILQNTKVKTYNEKINTFEYKNVINIYNNGKKECIKLKFRNTEIICTYDHLILTKNRGWIKAIDLTTDDDVLSNK